MPFANLPSSPGFQAPQAPNWGQFAALALQALEHRPIINTADAVNQAVGQINQILQLSSPMAKMQRQLQMLQLAYQTKIFKDYQANPGQFLVTANGPIYKNSYQGMKLGFDLAKEVAQTKNVWLRNSRMQNPPSNPNAGYYQAIGMPVPSINMPSPSEASEVAQDISNQGFSPTVDTTDQATQGTQ